MHRTASLILSMGILSSPVWAQPHADTYEWAVITHPGNRATIPEETPLRPDVPIGSVDYVFRIAKTEVTVGQWFEFVTAYAPFYDLNGIADPDFTGQSINYAFDGLYILPGVSHQRPSNMSWEYAARYCNWLHNGQVNEAWAFESGVYDTSTFTFNPDGTPNHQFRRSPGARYWIPSLDEWTKAAHYDPNRYGPGQEGYWLYPNGSNERSVGGGLLPDQGGERNAGTTNIWPIDVASFPHIQSPYGLLDASGGMSEWLEEHGVSLGAQPGVMAHGGSPFIDYSDTEPDNPDRIDYYFGFWVYDTVSWSGFRLAGALPCVADLAAPHGVLDRADLNAYLTAYHSGDSAADLAEPLNTFNFFDIAAFLIEFLRGCP